MDGWLPRTGAGEGVSAGGYGLSSWGDENVLIFDSGDSDTSW